MRAGWYRGITVTTAAVLLSAGGKAAFARKAGEVAPGAAFVAAGAWAVPKAHSPDPSAPVSSQPAKPDPNEVLRVPGSARSYTVAEMNSSLFAPDWFPQDHLPAPEIVLRGRKPALACAYCHLPDGSGDTTAPALAGLPKAYILGQIAAFRDGKRRPPNPDMSEEARHLANADLQQAANYFSSLKFHPIRRVAETPAVPQTHWQGYALVADKDGAREPIGERIIEMPEDFKLYDLGDERVGFVAYVPPGSIERGAVIAAKGEGAAPGCESCHGANLQGAGDIPPLAGRSPTYLARELILFRLGKRSNPGGAPMRMEVSHLTLRDMIDVAAYAASRSP